MKPSTSLMMGMAPSLIRRVSSSAMPVLALPWRMAAYMRSSFRLLRRIRVGGERYPNSLSRTMAGARTEESSLQFDLAQIQPGAVRHTAAFLPLEHDCRPPQTAGTFLPPDVRRNIVDRRPPPATARESSCDS